jgi:hypothetical protein
MKNAPDIPGQSEMILRLNDTCEPHCRAALFAGRALAVYPELDFRLRAVVCPPAAA